MATPEELCEAYETHHSGCQDCEIADGGGGVLFCGAYRPKEAALNPCVKFNPDACAGCSPSKWEAESGPYCFELPRDEAEAPALTGEDLGTLDEVMDGGFEGLAQEIRKLAEGVRQIESAGLNRRGLIVLLADASGMEKIDAGRILDALGSLEKRFLTDE